MGNTKGGLLNNLSAKRLELVKSHFPKGLVFVDLETTGLSPIGDEIIEIGAVKIHTDGSETTFEQLICPDSTIPQETIDIHGITNEMVVGSPKLSEILPDFLEFVGGSPMVAHNARFDAGFIITGLHQNSIKANSLDIHCSCLYAKRVLKSLQSHSLKNLAKHFNIDLENHHRALDDAYTCLEVFFKTLEGHEKFKTTDSYLYTLDTFKSIKNVKLPLLIERMRHEIFHQLPLLINYKGGSLKMEYRPIKPSSLMPLPEGPVLYGLCMVSGMYKSFSIKKIKDIKVPDEDELEDSIFKGKRLVEEKRQ